MRKSPQKEAAERKAAQKHEAAVQTAIEHIQSMREAMADCPGTERGREARSVFFGELTRLVREDDVYMEAASEVLLQVAELSMAQFPSWAKES